MTNEISRREFEKLSQYVDGELEAHEAAKIEELMVKNPAAREVFTELQTTRQLLGELPEIRLPKSYTLTPEMVGIKSRSTAYPVMRFATVIAALGLVVLVGLDFLSSGISLGARAPAMEAQMEFAAPAAEMLPEAEVMKSAVEEEALVDAPAEMADTMVNEGIGAAQEGAEEERAVAEEPQAPIVEGEAVAEGAPSYAATPLPTTTSPDELAEAEMDTTDDGMEEELVTRAQDVDEPLSGVDSELLSSETSFFRISPRMVLRGIEIVFIIVILLFAGLTLYFRRRS